jgi:hypothetical protein
MFKGAKLEDLEDALVIFIEQVNVLSGAVTNDLIKEHVEILVQQMSVTNFVHRNWYLFCSKKIGHGKGECCIRWYCYKRYRYMLHSSAFLLPSRSPLQNFTHHTTV